MDNERLISVGTVEDVEQGEKGFVFRLGQEKVGEANLEFCDDLGVPIYFLSYLHTEEKYENNGIATVLLKKVNDFLEEKGTLGVLVNVIPISRDEKIYSIYEKNNWKRILGEKENLLIYKPSSINEDEVYELIKTIKKVEGSCLLEETIDFSNIRELERRPVGM